MTTTYIYYEDWLASLGNPDHHVLIGVDWWGCLCGHVKPSDCGFHTADGVAHAVDVGCESVAVNWSWENVEDVGPTFADLHQYLWETEPF